MLPRGQLTSLRVSKQGSRRAREREKTPKKDHQSFHNLISEVIVHCFCHLMFLWSESKSPSHSREGDYARVLFPGDENLVHHLGGCLPHPCSPNICWLKESEWVSEWLNLFFKLLSATYFNCLAILFLVFKLVLSPRADMSSFHSYFSPLKLCSFVLYSQQITFLPSSQRKSRLPGMNSFSLFKFCNGTTLGSVSLVLEGDLTIRLSMNHSSIWAFGALSHHQLEAHILNHSFSPGA